jgi:hypothetical protein
LVHGERRSRTEAPELADLSEAEFMMLVEEMTVRTDAVWGVFTPRMPTETAAN